MLMLSREVISTSQTANTKEWLHKMQQKAAVCRAFNYIVEEVPRQGRLEGCHRMSAATHLICGLESV